MTASIGILDDDPEFSELLSTLLRTAGHEVTAYASAGKLLDAMLKHCPSLLVLDVHLPGMNGLELIRLLRRSPECPRLPIIAVSAEERQPQSVVQGFNDGADEYLIKPIDAELFIARVDSLLRRARDQGLLTPAETLTAGPLSVDLERREARLAGGPPLVLRHLEFDLLVYFLRNAGRVMTRTVILQEVWNEPAEVTTRTVDKHVENLRKRLGKLGGSIETIVGVGYCFKPK